MTQHNAALVEETNQAISTTEMQVSDLDRLVDLFTIDADGTKAEAIAPPRRRVG